MGPTDYTMGFLIEPCCFPWTWENLRLQKNWQKSDIALAFDKKYLVESESNLSK